MKKGFVLMETIIVIIVISVALLTIFASYNKILSKVKTENKYDTSEYIYMTNYVKKYLKEVCTPTPLTANNIPTGSSFILTEHLDANSCGIEDKNLFGIKKIYILTNLNEFHTEIGTDTDGSKIYNSNYFDAYMIDYIKQLDVTDEEELLIVEYNRPVLDHEGHPVSDGNGNNLNETYISSVRWN